MRLIRVCLASLSLILVLMRPLGAQPVPGGPDGGAKQALAVRVPHDAIHVDGRLDEPAWLLAPSIVDFVQKEPTEGAQPTQQTEIRFVYDDVSLYVGARMNTQAGSSIQAPMGRRDRGEQSEQILVALDTFHDRRTAYVFGVTAAGVRIDRYHPRDDETTYDEGFGIPRRSMKRTIGRQSHVRSPRGRRDSEISAAFKACRRRVASSSCPTWLARPP